MNRPFDSAAAPLPERRRWFSMRSLRARLVLTGLLLQAIVLGTFYAVATGGIGEAFGTVAQRAGVYLEALGEALAIPLAQRDTATVEKALERLRDGGVITGYRVTDARGALVLGTRDWPADDARVLKGALRDAAGGALGSFEFALRGVTLAERAARLRTQFLWFGALLLLVSALTGFVIVTRLTRNVRRMADAAIALERGALDARSGVSSHDEVGSFAATFDRMADSIQKLVREAREQDRRLAMVQDASVAGIWDWDIASNYVYFSPQFMRLLGYSDEAEFRAGFMFSTTLHPEDRERMVRLQRDYLARKVARFDAEYRVRRRDGSYLWVHALGIAQWDPAGDTAARFTGSMADVTARREAEQEVRALHDERKRAEAALRENEARFYHALRGSRDAIWDWDLVADRYYMSPRMREMLGYGFSEPITVRSWFLGHVHEDDLPRLEQTVRRHLELREPYELDYRLRAQDGGVRWTRERGRAVYDAEGRPVRFSGANSDITAEREAQDARRRADLELKSAKEFSEALLAAQPGVFCVLDKAGRLLRWNRNLEALTGYDPHELAAIGTRIVALADQEEMDAAVYRVFKLGAASVEASLVTRSGRHIPQLWTAARWEAGGETYLVASAVDISEIRALNQQLELRVAERTAELTRANRELESFSYTVSHDLSGPLRAINGFATLLVEELGDELRPDAQHYLERLLAGSVQMQALIDDLLRLAQVSRSRLVSSEVDLAALARRVAADCAQQHAPRSVSFESPGRLDAHGDASLLRIALANLIGNAWKFTARRDGAKIEFGALARGGERVYFLRDNGAGFDMQYADKLFKPFQRLHDTRDFPGTGIGLAIVHRIVERHGGRIWVESAPGAGTTFYFTLGA